MIRTLGLFCAFVLTLPQALSAQTTWTGAVDSDWHNAGNWSAGVPDAATDATVPVAGNFPTLGSIDGACRDLQVVDGSVLFVPAGRTLTASGSVNPAFGGQILGEGTVVLAGTGSHTFSGDFPNLTQAGSGVYSRSGDVVVVGNFLQEAGSGLLSENLGGIGSWFVEGDFTILGAGFVGVSGSTTFLTILDVGGDVTFTPSSLVTAEFFILSLGGDWLSDANYAPATASGSVVFTGSADGTVSVTSSTSFGAITIEDNIQVTWNGDFVAGSFITIGTGATVTTSATTLSVSGVGFLLAANSTFTANNLVSMTADGVSFSINGTFDAPLLTSITPLVGGGGADPVLVIPGDGILNAPNAVLDVDGLSVSGRASLAESTHTVGSTLQVFGNLTTGPTTVFELDADSASVFSVTALPNVTLTGSSRLEISSTNVQGDLIQTDAGAFVVLGGDIAVAGDVSLAGTVSANASRLILNGGTPQTLVANNPLSSLTVAAGADVTWNAPVDLLGNLIIDGTLTTDATAISVSDNLQVTGTFNAPSATVTISSSSSSIFGPVPSLCIAGTATFTADTQISGDLIQKASSSSLNWVQDADVTVSGVASFEGGLVTALDNTTLDVEGDINFATTNALVQVTDPPRTIFSAANWVSNANFAPTTGTVIFDGVVQQIVQAVNLSLDTLNVNANADIVLQVQNLLVRQDLSVDAGGSLDLDPGNTYAVDGDVINDGTIGGEGVLTVVGTANTLSGAGAFGRTAINTTGTITTVGAVNIARDLDVQAGTLVVPADELTVAEAFVFTNSTLDLDGDLRVQGDFLADDSFDTRTGSGTVILDGSANLQGTGPTNSLGFAQVVVTGGQRTVVGNLQILSPIVDVNPDGILSVENNTLGFSCTGLNVNGQLRVQTGATVQFDPASTVNVSVTGTLFLVGTFAQPVTFRGPMDGSNSIVLNGFIEAQHFIFEDLPPDGVVITPSAQFAPAPRDLRDGLFRQGSSVANSTLLTIERSNSQDFFNLSFENNPATATFNVRAPVTSAALRFISFGGAFGGPAFEDDPGGLIEWLASADQTLVDTFQAGGLSNGIELLFRTVVEFDAISFHLLRSTSPLGPFTEIPASPLTPGGGNASGASYVVQDLGLPTGVTQHYRLEQETTGVGRVLLSTASSAPLPATFGEVAVVGPGGFADVDAALAVAPVGGTVLIEPGTYPTFSITQSVRIVARDSGPVTIDTSLGRLQVRDLGAGSFVSIHGLRVSGDGMDIRDVPGSVVLDQVEVIDSITGTALLLQNAPQVKLQDCSFDGTVSIELSQNSTAYVARGSYTGPLDVNDSSTLVHVDTGLTPLDIQSEPGATTTALPGTSPRLEIPFAIPVGAQLPLEITGTPNHYWVLYRSNLRDWQDLNPVLPFVDMVLLLDSVAGLPVYTMGQISPSGSDSLIADKRPTDPALIGLTLPAQVVSVDPVSFTYRFGNLVEVTFLP